MHGTGGKMVTLVGFCILSERCLRVCEKKTKIEKDISLQESAVNEISRIKQNISFYFNDLN